MNKTCKQLQGKAVEEELEHFPNCEQLLKSLHRLVVCQKTNSNKMTVLSFVKGPSFLIDSVMILLFFLLTWRNITIDYRTPNI